MWKEVVIVFFMILTGTSWIYYQLATTQKITPTDAAFGIFIEILGSGLTILVLDKIWHYEERKRWKEVKDDVLKLLSEEITEIFVDFASILIPPIVVSISSDEEQSEEAVLREMRQKTNEHRLNELSRLASGSVDEIRRKLLEEGHLLDGEYGDLYNKRYSNLNDIDMKHGKFLDPSILKPLINLERLLKSLSSNIRVRQKLREGTGAFLVPSVEEKIFHRVHEILKILEKCKNIGLLKLE